MHCYGLVCDKICIRRKSQDGFAYVIRCSKSSLEGDRKMNMRPIIGFIFFMVIGTITCRAADLFMALEAAIMGRSHILPRKLSPKKWH